MNWYYNRIPEHITAVKQGYASSEIKENITICPQLLSRWKTNIDAINILLESKGYNEQYLYSRVPEIPLDDVTRIKCTYLDRPIIVQGNAVIIRPPISYNPVQPYFDYFNKVLYISGIDLTGYDIPQNTEYLMYTQINDLELAMEQAVEMIENATFASIHSSGISISGEDISW